MELCVIAFVYLVILLVIVGLGAGTGFLLHLILPTVELDIGILIGVLATGFSVDFVARLLNSANSSVDDNDTVQISYKPPRFRPRSRRKS